MRLAAMKAKVRTIDLVVPGGDGEEDETVWIRYKPGEMTLEVAEKLQELVTAGKDQEVLSAMILPVLDAWDLQDEEGHELPVNAETLKGVPVQFIGQIIGAITDDARPNPQKAALSVVT